MKKNLHLYIARNSITITMIFGVLFLNSCASQKPYSSPYTRTNTNNTNTEISTQSDGMVYEEEDEFATQTPLQTEGETVASASYEDEAILDKMDPNGETIQILDDYFYEISTNKGIDVVNERILELTTMFESANSIVLISLGLDDSGQPIYETPMTITEYCNYLKFKKEHKHKVKDLTYNNAGKIKKLVLTY